MPADSLSFLLSHLSQDSPSWEYPTHNRLDLPTSSKSPDSRHRHAPRPMWSGHSLNWGSLLMRFMPILYLVNKASIWGQSAKLLSNIKWRSVTLHQMYLMYFKSEILCKPYFSTYQGEERRLYQIHQILSVQMQNIWVKTEETCAMESWRAWTFS